MNAHNRMVIDFQVRERMGAVVIHELENRLAFRRAPGVYIQSAVLPVVLAVTDSMEDQLKEVRT